MDEKEKETMSFEEQTYEFARNWAKGIGRREFLKYAGVSAAALAFCAAFNDELTGAERLRRKHRKAVVSSKLAESRIPIPLILRNHLCLQPTKS